MKRLLLIACLSVGGLALAYPPVIANPAGIPGPAGGAGAAGATGPAGPSAYTTAAPADNGTATTLYVSTTGNDSNACTAGGASACLTIQGAVNKLPKLLRHPYTISVGAGTFAAGAYVSGFQIDMGQYAPASATGPYLLIEGTLANASLTGLMSGSVASATANGTYLQAGNPATLGTVTVTGAGWTSGQLFKSLFCVTGGTGNGECALVSANTATVATIEGGWNIATPDGTSTFAIKTWATDINGVLARPPGALSGQGATLTSFSATYGAAFYVADNAAAGWRSGYSVGIGYSNTPPIYANRSWTDAPIAISNFQFSVGDNGVGVGLTGSELVAFDQNFVDQDGGIGLRASGESSAYVISNRYDGNAFGDNLVDTQAYDGHSTLAGENGFLFLAGNIEDDQGNSGSTLAYSSVPTVSYQNLCVGNGLDGGSQGFECIDVVNQSGDFKSFGDQVENVQTGIRIYTASTINSGRVVIDGLDCTSTTYCVKAGQDSQVYLANHAITGASNTNVLWLISGSQINVGVMPTATGTGANEINIDGNGFTWANLTAQQAILFGPTGSHIWTGTPTLLDVLGTWNFALPIGLPVYASGSLPACGTANVGEMLWNQDAGPWGLPEFCDGGVWQTVIGPAGTAGATGATGATGPAGPSTVPFVDAGSVETATLIVGSGTSVTGLGVQKCFITSLGTSCTVAVSGCTSASFCQAFDIGVGLVLGSSEIKATCAAGTATVGWSCANANSCDAGVVCYN